MKASQASEYQSVLTWALQDDRSLGPFHSYELSSHVCCRRTLWLHNISLLESGRPHSQLLNHRINFFWNLLPDLTNQRRSHSFLVYTKQTTCLICLIETFHVLLEQSRFLFSTMVFFLFERCIKHLWWIEPIESSKNHIGRPCYLNLHWKLATFVHFSCKGSFSEILIRKRRQAKDITSTQFSLLFLFILQ